MCVFIQPRFQFACCRACAVRLVLHRCIVVLSVSLERCTDEAGGRAKELHARLRNFNMGKQELTLSFHALYYTS